MVPAAQGLQRGEAAACQGLAGAETEAARRDGGMYVTWHRLSILVLVLCVKQQTDPLRTAVLGGVVFFLSGIACVDGSSRQQLPWQGFFWLAGSC